MQLPVVTRDGKKAGSLDVADAVFGAKVNVALTHQIVVSQLANRRQGTVDTKRRGEVAGGGSKPYKQKGTGRARQGSIRAPQYRGGGIVFGPHQKDYELAVPKQMRQAAMRSVLTSRAADGSFIVVEDLALPEARTRLVAELLGTLELKGTVLFVTDSVDELFLRAARNHPRVTVLPAAQVSVVDLVSPATVVATRAAVAALEARLLARPSRGVEEVA